ncbi:MAG: family 78 glycoside hydrolase catalytic domain, partial [Eubacteriales bacterium]|nr:family 78 glycoside hydrolase catalytic domain [Eubacteriales bacterium]
MKLSFITPAAKLACPRFIREFAMEDFTRAALTLTGLGLYRAYLNGARVGEDYLTPGYNDYTAYLRCQTYDVSGLLRAQNRLEIVLGDGWYKGRFGLDGGTRDIFGSEYMLAARLTVTQKDGSERVLETDESWRASASVIEESSIYDGEKRDDTRDVSESVPCVAIQPPCEPEEDETPRIRQMLTLRPTLLTSPTGESILDFGQNMVGVVRFVNRAPRGAQLRLQFGEVLQNGCFYRDNLRTAKAEYRYVSDGVEKEIEPLFTCYGFRYAKLEGFEHPRAEDFTGVVLYSSLRQTLDVETDHPQLNQLMQNALWGQRGNFVDVPTDCPQRDERLGWTADTQVFVNTACYQMDCKDFYRKYMRDMRIDQQRYYQGDIPMFSPSLRGQAGHGGAVWADAGTIIPWNLYMNYGDKELLEE